MATIALRSAADVRLPDDLSHVKALVPRLQTRTGYFGTGSRIHLYVGSPEAGWWCVCGGVPHNWNRTRPDYEGLQLPAAARATVDCWRCAKAVGLVDRYPGTEERRRLDRLSPEVRRLVESARGALAALGQSKTFPADIDAARRWLQEGLEPFGET